MAREMAQCPECLGRRTNCDGSKCDECGGSGKVPRDFSREMIVPQCCESAKQLRSILLQSEPDGSNPHWYLRLHDLVYCEANVRLNSGSEAYKLNRISHCPHCGTKLPEIEANPKPPKPLFTSDEYGDYCETCGERAMGCKCWPPWFKWRIA